MPFQVCSKSLIIFISLNSQSQGDCRDYTFGDCTAQGPFETNRDLGTEEVCQIYCNEIYDGTDENPKCEFYSWDNQKKDCSFFDYPMDDYTNSCDGVAGTPLPGLTDCQASTDECLVSITQYLQLKYLVAKMRGHFWVVGS